MLDITLLHYLGNVLSRRWLKWSIKLSCVISRSDRLKVIRVSESEREDSRKKEKMLVDRKADMSKTFVSSKACNYTYQRSQSDQRFSNEPSNDRYFLQMLKNLWLNTRDWILLAWRSREEIRTKDINLIFEFDKFPILLIKLARSCQNIIRILLRFVCCGVNS